jgi:hypothetical protein
MSGGLFGRPFVLNIKCIIFALLVMLIFLYKPNITNPWILYTSLFIIFVIAYVVMAWYDYFYDCRLLPLKRNKYSLTGLFKPPPHTSKQVVEYDSKNNRTLENPETYRRKENYRNKLVIYVSHIIIIVPLLLYVVIYKDKVNTMIYPILGVLVVFTLLYHGTSLITLSHK